MSEAVRAARPPARARVKRTALPILAVLAILLLVWYPAAAWMNHDRAQSLADDGATSREIWTATMSLDRPVLPAPHQIAGELADSILDQPIASPRNLLFHAGVTAEGAALGLALALFAGIASAIGIVHVRALDRSVMPWIVASQTIPILAIAPMVIIVLGHAGIIGWLPKALIVGYLSFLPITIAMVTGLRAADPMQRDLMRTYNASASQILAKLRWPASLPFLFPSLKVAAALALTGAIVAELPTGAQAGLGVRLLAGSYYGQTLQIWAALVVAAALAMLANAAIGLAEAGLRRARGGRL